MWRARLSRCLPTESLCCQCEPDSATFPAESLSCVWSESESAAYSSRCCTVHSDCWQRACIIEERLSVSAESTRSHIDSGGLIQSQGANGEEREHLGEHQHLVDPAILQ